MDTEEDMARDEFISDLYNDFANDLLAGKDGDLFYGVVERFAAERLQSFYLDNPDVAKAPLWSLGEARSLVADHPSAALVFAVTAMEVGLKAALMKPILHGLVHAEFAGALIAELATDNRQDRSKALVFALLAEYGGLDLKTYKRSGATKTLWEEMADVQKARNVVVHRAQPGATADATLAIDLASHVVETLFALVIAKLGLHTHGAGLQVCGKKH
jgi:hypothetical protein